MLRRANGSEKSLGKRGFTTAAVVMADPSVATLTERPGHQHVIITGRRADPKIIAVADLVTEMTKINHPFDRGAKGQRGIEW